MRATRVVAAATALALLCAIAATGAASAGQTGQTGVGTGSASTTVLSLALGANGSLLNARVLGDDSRSTIDPKTANPPEAFSRLSPLTLSSSVVPALNVSAPTVESRSTGALKSVTVPSASVPAAVPAAVATGTVAPGSLTAVVDSAGARSGLASSVTNLSVAGGALLAVPTISSNLSTSAASAASNGLRGLSVDSLTVADLGALLKGLGINPAALSLSAVTNLVSQLGVTANGLTGSALAAQLTSLNTAIQGVANLVSSAGSGTTIGSVTGTLGSALGSLGQTLTSGSTVSTATDVVNQLTSQLQGLLANVLPALDAAPLLSVQGLQVGITTKAADTIANSAAGITAKIASLKVGNVSLPGLDLAAAAATASSTVSTLTSKLGSTLGAINPGLANMITVQALTQSKSISASGGYTHALAGITALTVKLTPPANLAAIVGSLNGALSAPTSVGSILGSALPALPQASAISQLASSLGNATSAVGALSQGATITVGQVQASADFAPVTATAAPSTPAPNAVAPTELPRTGQDSSGLAVLGVLLVATAVGLIRWLRRPAT